MEKSESHYFVDMAQRIESVDILRGITIVAMILVNNPGNWSHVYAPLLHADFDLSSKSSTIWSAI